MNIKHTTTRKYWWKYHRLPGNMCPGLPCALLWEAWYRRLMWMSLSRYFLSTKCGTGCWRFHIIHPEGVYVEICTDVGTGWGTKVEGRESLWRLGCRAMHIWRLLCLHICIRVPAVLCRFSRYFFGVVLYFLTTLLAGKLPFLSHS